MKKIIALFSAFLSIALLISMMGCGASGVLEYHPVEASLLEGGGTRGIRVSWAEQIPPEQYSLVEYQILRFSPTDAVRSYIVVGVAGPDATTFIDSIQARVVNYNNIPGDNGSVLGAGNPSTLLTPTSVTAPGLTPGSYSYIVRALYRINGSNYYGTTNVLHSTQPVTFQ